MMIALMNNLMLVPMMIINHIPRHHNMTKLMPKHQNQIKMPHKKQLIKIQVQK